MDQQFDQYQKNIGRFAERIQAGVFPGVLPKTARVLGLFLAVIVYLLITQISLDIAFASFAFVSNERSGLIVYALFLFVPHVLTLAGLIQTLRVARIGWVLISTFFMYRLVGQVALFISFFRYQRYSGDVPLLTLLDSVLPQSLSFTVLWLLFYLLGLGYFMSKPIRSVYSAKRAQVFAAIGITLGVYVCSTLLSIMLNYE